MCLPKYTKALCFSSFLVAGACASEAGIAPLDQSKSGRPESARASAEESHAHVCRSHAASFEASSLPPSFLGEATEIEAEYAVNVGDKFELPFETFDGEENSSGTWYGYARWEAENADQRKEWLRNALSRKKPASKTCPGKAQFHDCGAAGRGNDLELCIVEVKSDKVYSAEKYGLTGVMVFEYVLPK